MNKKNLEKQVISKQRVTDHGEVYTSQREVRAMLNLVRSETERIDSRFLEPACGTGNFLAEILIRKLRVVALRYGNVQLEYERNAVLAVSSLYGIDILADNIQVCRDRLFEVFFRDFYDDLFGDKVKEECCRSVKYILECNIIHETSCKSVLTVNMKNKFHSRKFVSTVKNGLKLIENHLLK